MIPAGNVPGGRVRRSGMIEIRGIKISVTGGKGKLEQQAFD